MGILWIGKNSTSYRHITTDLFPVSCTTTVFGVTTYLGKYAITSVS
jgi:hypothetical protein